jgi:hypothetical protein
MKEKLSIFILYDSYRCAEEDLGTAIGVVVA